MSDGVSTWKRMNGYAPGYTILVAAVLFCGFQWWSQGKTIVAQGDQLEAQAKQLAAQSIQLTQVLEAVGKLTAEVASLHDRAIREDGARGIHR